MWCQNLEIKFYNLNAIYLDTKLLQSRQFFKQTWQERRQARNTYTCFQKYKYILFRVYFGGKRLLLFFVSLEN